MNIIEPLQWRYATKRMTGEKIPEKDLESILEALRLTPSAYGLQPYSVVLTEKQGTVAADIRAILSPGSVAAMFTPADLQSEETTR